MTIRRNNGHTAVLHTTSRHPFWDATLHAWVQAGNLTSGHALTTATDRHIRIVSVHALTGAADMYNLTVADLHTYYVLAGATPVLVHNSRGCPTVGLGSPSHQAIGDPNAKGGVYALVSENGTVMRTGMATNLQSRLATHRRDYPGLTGVVLYRTDNRAARRGLEEMAENWYTPILANQRAIRLDNPRRQEYLQSARDFLDQWR